MLVILKGIISITMMKFEGCNFITGKYSLPLYYPSISPIIPLKENCLPLILARFHRTASVFAGCIMAHPIHPPIPELANIAVFDNGGGVVTGEVEVAIGKTDIINNKLTKEIMSPD